MTHEDILRNAQIRIGCGMLVNGCDPCRLRVPGSFEVHLLSV